MSIEVQSIASDCKGNNKDDAGRIMDPITMEPLSSELVTLVKVGNKCYSAESLRLFLLSFDNKLPIIFDRSDSDEWADSAFEEKEEVGGENLYIVRDPFTRQGYSREELKEFHEKLSRNRSRFYSPSGTSLNVNKLTKDAWKIRGGRMKKSRRKNRSNKKSKRSRKCRRSRRSNKKRK